MFNVHVVTTSVLAGLGLDGLSCGHWRHFLGMDGVRHGGLD